MTTKKTTTAAASDAYPRPVREGPLPPPGTPEEAGVEVSNPANPDDDTPPEARKPENESTPYQWPAVVCAITPHDVRIGSWGSCRLRDDGTPNCNGTGCAGAWLGINFGPRPSVGEGLRWSSLRKVPNTTMYYLVPLSIRRAFLAVLDQVKPGLVVPANIDDGLVDLYMDYFIREGDIPSVNDSGYFTSAEIAEAFNLTLGLFGYVKGNPTGDRGLALRDVLPAKILDALPPGWNDQRPDPVLVSTSWASALCSIHPAGGGPAYEG